MELISELFVNPEIMFKYKELQGTGDEWIFQ